jgi:hypothetical protein
LGPNNLTADLSLKQKSWIYFTAACLALSAASPLAAIAAAEPQFSLEDRELFPPEYFPGLHERSEAELLLAGLRAIYPRRILVSPPRDDIPEAIAPVVRNLGSNGTYIRVMNLETALPVIERHLSRQVLLIDFRFLTTDLESTMKLGSILTRRSRLPLRVSGEYPAPADRVETGHVIIDGRRLRGADQAVFTLTNRETRGPIEALLDQLKIDGDTISVGTASAGYTAVFRQFPDLPYYLMRGEIRAADGESLIEEGFVPRVRVDVSPEEDLIGYSSLREGVPLDQVVQARVAKNRLDEARLVRERAARGIAETETDDAETESPPLDLILQRAINIVKALQALGQVAG